MTTNLTSAEAEQYVLAAALSPDLIDDVLSQTNEALFAHEQNLTIYRAIKSLCAQGKPVDIVTMIESLRGTDLPGYLADLFRIPVTNYRAHIELLRGYELKRRLYSVGTEIIERVQGEDAQVVRESVINRLAEDEQSSDEPRTFRDVFLTHCPVMEARTEESINGLPTGFEKLDQRFNGLKPQDLIILAARPSFGKTTLAMNIAERTAMNDGVVMVFSMEMSAESLIEKMIASVGGIPLSEIKTGQVFGNDNASALTAAVVRLKDAKIIIDDRPARTVSDLRAASMKVRRKLGKISLIVADYLQLMKGEGQSREQEVSGISRGLKGLAKEMDCPVIALSQLSREVEKRPNKRPMGSDLRDSGAIEQDADIIMFLYNDEKYNPDTPHKGVTEVITAKFRNGETGTDFLMFQGAKSRFVNLAAGWAPREQAEIKPIRRGMTL